jgi:hypothetical protein
MEEPRNRERKCVISGFHRGVNEMCALLRFYTAQNGSFLPTFRDKQSVPSSRVKQSKKMEPISCPEMSVRNYHSTLHEIPKEHRSQIKESLYHTVVT